VAATAHFAGSSAVVFIATEHLASASGIVAVAPEIGGMHLHRHLGPVHLRWLEKLVRL
jgi:hypothetical protein